MPKIGDTPLLSSSPSCMQVNGGALPPHVIPFGAVAAVMAACLPIISQLLTSAEMKLGEAAALPQNAPQASLPSLALPLIIVTIILRE